MLTIKRELIMLISTVLFSTSIAFSQVAQFNGKDTVICITVKQSKFLVKKCFEAAQMTALDSICEHQRALDDSIHRNDVKMLQDYAGLSEDNSKIIALKDYSIKSLENSLKSAQKDTNKQKLYKWIAIVGEGALCGFLGYKAITH